MGQLFQDGLTFNDFDRSPNYLVSIYLLLDRRSVYVFISFSGQFQRTFGQITIA